MALEKDKYHALINVIAKNKGVIRVEYTLPPKTNGSTRKYMGYVASAHAKSNAGKNLRGYLMISNRLITNKPVNPQKVKLEDMLDLDILEPMNMVAELEQD